MDYGLAPWEDGDELIAAAFAARAVSTTDGFPKEREKLVAFIRRSLPGARLFSVAFALWALRDLPQVWAPGERESLLASLSRSANESGVYSWKSLGIGQDAASDPMPTAAALLAFCSSASSVDDVFDVANALAWLRSKQSENGSFPSRSPNRDKQLNHTLATDAATGYSLLAISTCATAGGAH